MSSSEKKNIDPLKRALIERFLRDMQEQLRSSDDDTSDTGVCSQEFVESLKFIER